MRHRRLLKIALPVAMLAIAATALAYWTLAALGSASASVGSLNPPTGVSASASANSSSVSVTWNASDASETAVAPQGYYVTRTDTTSNQTTTACGSSASNLVTSGTSCQDTSVPDGTYTYKVTAAYRTWTAASDPSSSVSVQAAFTPPHTTATLSPQANAAGWSKEQTTVHLAASAGTAPVQSITYSTSGAQTTQSTTAAGDSASLAVNTEGTTTVRFYATDTAGRNEAEQTQTVKLDKSPPTTTDNTAAIGATAKNTSQTVTLSPSENPSSDASGIDRTYYTTDGSTPSVDSAGSPQGTTQVYDSASKIALANDGLYTVKYFSVDVAGNREPVRTASTVIWIDKTAPAPTVTSPTNNAVALPNPALSGKAGTAPGDASTVAVKVYSGSTATGAPVQTTNNVAVNANGDWSTSTSGLSAGNTYTAQVTQADSATNIGAATSTFRVSTITLASPPSGSFTNTAKPTPSGNSSSTASATVNIYSGSTATGTPVKTLTPTFSGSSAPFGWTTSWGGGPGLADGPYTVQATQGSSTSSSNTFTVDATAPSGGSISYPNGYASPPPQITLNSGTDATSGIDKTELQRQSTTLTNGTCGTFGGIYTTIATNPSSPYTDTSTTDGRCYQYQYVVTDRAGNSTTYTSANVLRVDTTPPTVSSISRSSASPTKATSVSWTVTMTESVTGVDASDFQLAKSGSVAATLGTVTGSGSSYTVSATGVSGTGDLQLKLVDDDSIKDAALNPLGGPGTGNGTFDGQTYAIDNTAPGAPAITSPTNNSYTNTGAFSVSGTAEANSTVTVKDGTTTLSGTVVADASGNWSKPLTGVSHGTHTYTATAQDAVGNTSAASNSVAVGVDTQAPAVAITSPTNGSSTKSTTPTISGTAGDATTPSPDNSTVTVKLYSGSNATGTPVQTLTPTRSSTSWSTSPNSLADGTYTAQAIQTDAAGNTGTSTAVSFKVDTQSPSASSLELQNKTGGQNVAGVIEQGDITTFGYSEQIDPNSVLSGWSGGSTAVTVRVTDNSNNDTLTVYDNANTTQLKLGSVALGGNYVTASANFAGTMTQSGNDIRVTIGKLNAGTVSSNAVNSSTATWTPSTQATDLAGNAVTATPTPSSTGQQF